MRSLRTLAILALLLAASSAKAQLHNNVWHFGFMTALDFNTDPPTSIPGFLNILEGSASVSDPLTGEHLFSSDGNRVVDRTGLEMPGGLNMIGGDGSSSQAATIIPFPFDQNRYYVIHCDQGGYARANEGVFYSVVDMRERDGLGDVVLKNQFLFRAPMVEKLTVVPHADGCALWIIAHSYHDEYQATLLRDTFPPVIEIVRSRLGHDPSSRDGFSSNVIGYLVANRQGNRLAYASPEGIVELVDFDNRTGIVSNAIRIIDGDDNPYGLCFSPNGQMLYVARESGDQIVQFDVGLPEAQIRGSRESFGDNVGGNIRPGPDGKLYFATRFGNYIGVIHNPDLRGTASNMEPNYIKMTSGTVSAYGLPNVLDALMNFELRPCADRYVRMTSSVDEGCEGDCIDMTAFVSGDLKIEWHISDGRRIDNDREIDLCFESPGTYTIRLLGITSSGDTVENVRRFVIGKSGNFVLRPQTIISDTVGDVIKVPILLSESISNVFQGTFTFDEVGVEYLGSFDRYGDRIDQGSEPGIARVARRLENDSLVGFMYFNFDWTKSECFSVEAKSSKVLLSGEQCLSGTTYSVCLNSACGSSTLYKFVKNSEIAMTITPNPASERLQLKSDHDLAGAIAHISDANGIEVIRNTIDHTYSLDISDLSAGVYFLTLRTNETAIRELFVVRR